jgi:hypothetical protein
MGKKSSAPAPKTTYTPPPPPPTIVQTPTQAVRTESALSEVAQAQQRLNMELGSQLDRTNEEFFAGQDIRRTQAVGAETRLGQRVAGEEERAGIRVTGEESRFGQRVAGQEERAGIRTTGRESRLGQRLLGKKSVLVSAPLGKSREKQLVKLVRKPGRRTCNKRCLGAIKRTEITNKLNSSTDHERLDSRPYQQRPRIFSCIL